MLLVTNPSNPSPKMISVPPQSVVAVNTMLSPSHTEDGVGSVEICTLGAGFMVKCKTTMLSQPVANDVVRYSMSPEVV